MAGKKAPPKFVLERPARSKAAERAETETARILLDVPKPLYRALKVRCAERGVTMKAYLLGLLEADGLE